MPMNRLPTGLVMYAQLGQGEARERYVDVQALSGSCVLAEQVFAFVPLSGHDVAVQGRCEYRTRLGEHLKTRRMRTGRDRVAGGRGDSFRLFDDIHSTYDCVQAGVAKNQYLALALSTKNGPWGSWAATTATTAGKNALAWCKYYGGGNDCTVEFNDSANS